MERKEYIRKDKRIYAALKIISQYNGITKREVAEQLGLELRSYTKGYFKPIEKTTGFYYVSLAALWIRLRSPNEEKTYYDRKRGDSWKDIPSYASNKKKKPLIEPLGKQRNEVLWGITPYGLKLMGEAK